MEKVEKIVEKILSEMGLELVSFSLKSGGKRSFVKIFADTPKGNVTLDQISKATSAINDSDEFYQELPEDFRLEVSSPGLDFPLKTAKDFRRNLEKTIKVKFSEGDSQKMLSGKLVSVEEDAIVITGKFGEKALQLSDIDFGKIEVKF